METPKLGSCQKLGVSFQKKLRLGYTKTMIRPHLDYIDFVVDSGSAEKVKKLDTLERKAIRRIEYCVNTTNRQEIDILRAKYKIEDLRLRRKRNLVKIMYSQSSDINNLKKVTTDKNLRSGNQTGQ